MELMESMESIESNNLTNILNTYNIVENNLDGVYLNLSQAYYVHIYMETYIYKNFYVSNTYYPNLNLINIL